MTPLDLLRREVGEMILTWGHDLPKLRAALLDAIARCWEMGR